LRRSDFEPSAKLPGFQSEFLAVLDAQRTLRDGEDRLAAAQTSVALSAISLYKALGGGSIQ
jgi:outer membrane protein TolC